MAHLAPRADEPPYIAYTYYKKIRGDKDVDDILKAQFAWLTKIQGVWYCEEISTYNYRLLMIKIDDASISTCHYTYGAGELKKALREFDAGVAAVRAAANAKDRARAQPPHQSISPDFYTVTEYDRDRYILLATALGIDGNGKQIIIGLDASGSFYKVKVNDTTCYVKKTELSPGQ